MSMQPKPWPDVPERTARTARASSRKGNLAMRIRDELDAVYTDERFVGAFGQRGKPGISPAQLMVVTVLQFTENLTDRQAAEAVRDRITWKYALAVAHPGWLTSVIDPSWQQVYGARIDNLHLPTSKAKRAELMLAYGRDGYHLLDQVYGPTAPHWLRHLPAVDALRRTGTGSRPAICGSSPRTTWTPGTASNATPVGAATRSTSPRPATSPPHRPTMTRPPGHARPRRGPES